MNMQDQSDKCTKKFLQKAEETMKDASQIPLDAIKRYCRMLVIYCDTQGKVTESFIKSMEKCIKEIKAVEGMEEVFNACNECPEDLT